MISSNKNYLNLKKIISLIKIIANRTELALILMIF